MRTRLLAVLPEQLPRLRGWSWTLFLIAWAGLLALGIYGTMRSLGDHKPRPSPEREYGVFASGNVVQMPFGAAAVAAGVRSGDHIVAVNGHSLDGATPSFHSMALKLGMPPVLELSTMSADGRLVSHRLRRSSANVSRTYASSGIGVETSRRFIVAMDLISGLLVPCGLAALLLLRRAHDPLAPWASLMMVGAPIGYGLAGHYLAGPGASDPVAGLANWLSPAIGWLEIAVLALFPDGSFRPRWTWAVLAAGVLDSNWMWLDTPTIPSNVALLLGQFAAIAVVVARYRMMAPGTGRQQIRWTLFGFGAALLCYAVLILMQTWLTYTTTPVTWVRLYVLQAAVSCLYNLLLIVPMTIGLMRFRLYDADATISRSVAYGALTLSLLAIFAGSEKVIEVLGERHFGESLGALANGLGAAIAATLIGPIHHRVTHWAERRFRSGLAHLREGLPLLVGDLRETASPQILADVMLARVERGVRASHGAVVAGGAILDVRDVDHDAVTGWIARGNAPCEGSYRLNCNRADSLFPMRVPLWADGTGMVGWLLLGPRPDGSFYGLEERNALRAIAEPVARALAVSIERERRETDARARENNLRSEVAALRRRCDVLEDAMGRPYNSQKDVGTLSQ